MHVNCKRNEAHVGHNATPQTLSPYVAQVAPQAQRTARSIAIKMSSMTPNAMIETMRRAETIPRKALNCG